MFQQERLVMTDFELQQFVAEEIKSVVAESPENRLKDIDGTPIFEKPLVGFADGDDPLFQQYKQIIGDFHLTPREALAKHIGEVTGREPEPMPHVGVISWILPIAKATKLSNAKMTDGPSLRWNHTRWQGEAFNESLRRHVASLLEERGHPAVAPMLASFFKIVTLPNGFASTWSERHAAFAAGLGTFSLNDAMITKKGIAMRCGSVVSMLKVKPTPRPYQHHQAYCPYVHDGSCGICIARCPAGAIGPNGHDKNKCRKYMFGEQRVWAEARPGYVGAYAGCGLCQTKVPCQSRIPPKRR